MLKVGLTGGYASGKSFVAAELERLGCHLIYADRLGHIVLEPGGEAFEPTLQEFGHEILAADGIIDRKKLASIVFADPPRLALLNSFIHPAVIRLEEQMITEFAAQNPHGVTVIEAAILIETGRYKFFDRLILTTCRLETQIARAMARDKLTREQVLARLDRQLPGDEKRKYADYVIDTDGPKARTVCEVQKVYSELKELAESKRV
ncbi:MAG: dephospho-CoA kinase [Acidobacteriaceae bacterium]|nr:dephospho-CoA kinase [Acidobacteriaceae bacterium]